ncbi:MAG: hypothetical protein COT39_03875 [Parcubacteria group bacterium CG08_land_8_20_14_0_20_48_21]|nr:MAG: hypothetical protein COT39_03875 [Parcubacteria group bacterium CG08_land_8_20_14_0_20_48_21]PIW78974.1 MAG: hypothetical protein COZ99_03535 [Parcubacteria group bacterium CG_4_8_14_3_um_filter_48_16]PIY78336.1 MAG: hypothetical protein COY83_00670 [Parcubacteria group bacterium CG_4_10_14_0_8_um_filter_48_154]PJC39581.1 MAG: hypothetical protein CO043_03500 [Parcubacteria group bacterium CG_4_9_14_0_2_um_filter_48_40]PJE53122.1 MAG: hypothetical protein COV80_00530 [Parcubacteria grou
MFLTALGGIFRVYLAVQAGSFWFDEAFSVHFASLPLKKMAGYLLYEHHPLLHFTLLHYWIRLFGDGETATRLLSALFGTLAIPLGYATGKRLFNKKVGVVTALFIALSSFQIFHSAQSRMYEMFFFFTLASLYTFWQWYKTQRLSSLAAYLVATVLLIHTHLFGLFVPLVQNIFLLLEWFFTKPLLLPLFQNASAPEKRYLEITIKRPAPNHLEETRVYYKTGKLQAISWLTAQFILGTTYLIWLMPVLVRKFAQPLDQGWWFNQLLPQFFLTGYVQNFFFIGGSLFLPIALLCTLGISIALGASLVRIKIQNARLWTLYWKSSPQVRFLWLLVVVSFSVAVALHLDNRPQYFMSAAAAVYLLVASGITASKHRWFFGIVLGTVLVLMGSTTNVLRTTPLFNTDKIAETISQKERSGDIILLHGFMNKLPFDRYYKGSLPIYGFYPLEDTADENLRYIIHNWHPVVTLENVHMLEQYIKNAQRIFLVYYVTGSIDEEELAKNWLYLHGWRIVETYTFSGPIDLPVFLLERN